MLFCLTAERVRKRYGWDVLAYVLMNNHYHLLLHIGERGLSDGMHDLTTVTRSRSTLGTVGSTTSSESGSGVEN